MEQQAGFLRPQLPNTGRKERLSSNPEMDFLNELIHSLSKGILLQQVEIIGTYRHHVDDPHLKPVEPREMESMRAMST